MLLKTIKLAPVAAVAMITLAGCGSLRPQPLTMEETQARAASDRKYIDDHYVPLNGPLSLAEAISRSLKYNYDAQLSKTEANLQERQLDLAFAQMLPRLAVGAGYDGRNNYNASQSIDVKTQSPSLQYSYSQQPQYTSADLTLTWNALDLGISYFGAKQQGFRALIAVERRRKVIDNISRTTANAYWRAASAAQLLPKIDPMLKTAREILKVSRQVSNQNLQSPLALLDFQQNMVIVLSELERIHNDLTAAHIELASLINIPSDSVVTYTVAPDTLEPTESIDNHKLEMIGLAMRPELRIEQYQQKIDQQDVYKEIIKMLPGVGIVSGLNYNSNNLLYQSTWAEVGVRATFNIFNLVQGPLAIKVAKGAVELSEERRLALSVAVLSQVNLAIQDYANSLNSYKTAQEVDKVGEQIGRVANDVSMAGAQSEADRIRRQLTVLTTRIQRDKAQVKVLGSLASIYSATGMDLVPAGAEMHDLPTLTAEVERSVSRWQMGQLPEMSQ
ncbi:MAG: TolC family protein [Proteobacteria bacterium]|nr:TolC family protein [Pseudomonadota bacterium]